MTTESICIVDFCGYTHPGHFPYSCWADYWPADGVVTFGGDWCEVPNWYVTAEPTEEQVEAYAKEHTK